MDVIDFMDVDGGGEIDAVEFTSAVHAARRNEIDDEHILKMMLAIDNELKLKQIKIADLFRMLDESGDGSLSRDELRAGLQILVSSNENVEQKRALALARRQAAERKWKLSQEKSEEVKSWLDRPESLPLTLTALSPER
eukprot:CAMPEP_0119501336 /NCGR_PEP_ID=MMETSP1344-20130328/23206_1 /TAXON_ID=236787 /ORGANISM="Florenciella parvula, Strain CCMP2471" /LENGTH=138 /DNA_ID=CAMNT_0007537493 /DNA_START=1 /DNA_END=413 /DNA_ORIENTATION=+